MSGVKLQRLGMVMVPEPGNPHEVEGVLNPAAVRGNFHTTWIYLVGPLLGALIGVAFEWILKGKASAAGKIAARGTLGVDNPARPGMDAGPPQK